MPGARPSPCAGVVCLRGTGPDVEVLLIRRGKAPRLGEWSLPGGHIEWGERAADAALRELKEETGVEGEILGLIDVVDGLFGELHYVLIDYAVRWISGEPQGADDAIQAAFRPADEALRLVEWSETRRIIRMALAQFGGRAT